MTVWFDVEDLITHFTHESRPTGIQRLTFEIYREVWKAGGASGKVRFCRHGMTPTDYFVVEWPELQARIVAASTAALAEDIPPEAPLPGNLPALALAPAAPEAVKLNIWGRIHRYFYARIAPTVWLPLGVIYRSQRNSLTATGNLVQALLRLAARRRQQQARLGKIDMPRSSEKASFAPSDIFVSLGASWGLLNAAAGRHVQAHYGLRFAVLVHDLIPELYPEWTSPLGLPSYRAWLRGVVPYADHIFVYSQNTARDLLQRMAAWDRQIPMPTVLPVGHRPPFGASAMASAGGEQVLPSTIAFDRPFVLFVSTIEVRKNHALLFRVWRRLLENMPPEKVPYLVFAGKTAWLTKDLLVQMENANWLDGHIKLIESPTDPELAALYLGCAFTVFPSLYEGWGLPVTESLSFGKTVAASNRAAIPEAGGEFCCYFDPENLAEAYQVILGMIENPEHVQKLEALIADQFRPPDWADTAQALLEHVQSGAQAGPTDPEPQHQDVSGTGKSGQVKVAA